MFVRRVLAVAVMVAAVCLMSFAAYPASAQNATPAPCPDPNLIGILASTNPATNALDYTKINTVGTALLTLMKARYQAEDSVPLPGCEAAQTLEIQFFSTEEDAIFSTVAAAVDTANAAAYKDLATAAVARLKAMTPYVIAMLGGSGSTATASAAPAGGTPAATATPQACPDAGFNAQVKTDTSTLTGGANAIPFVKLRYKYEDLVAPTGCEPGRLYLIQSFTIAEDVAALAIMGQADSANASAYTDFLNNTVDVRATALGKAVGGFFPSMAPTQAATTASS